MPLPQRRVRFRRSRTAPNPEAGYNDEATLIKKTVRFGDISETHVRHVLPLRFEQIVGTESADYWMGFAEVRCSARLASQLVHRIACCTSSSYK